MHDARRVPLRCLSESIGFFFATFQAYAVSNQTWDLEQFDLSGPSLAVIGGFNYLTGVGTGSSAVFPMGDIFVYLGSEQPYTVPSAGDHDGPWTGLNSWD